MAFNYRPSEMSAALAYSHIQRLEELIKSRSKIAKISHLLKNDDEVSLEGDLLNTTKNYFLAANGYVSYAGEFNADDINVYHNIKTSLLPQWVGTTLTRTVSYTHLTLPTSDLV